MSSLLTLLAVYLLGGLTFIPGLLGLLFLHAYYTFPEVLHESPVPPLRHPEENDAVFKTEDERLVRRLTNSVDVAAGYFLVTREFVPGGINGKPPERTSPVGNRPQSESPSVYQSMYRSLFDRKSSIGNANSDTIAKARAKRASNEFFVVLRHGHLMLYDDEDQSEVRHVISLGLYSISIYGGGGMIPEGELYIRRNAICLTRRPASIDPATDENVANLPFFMFSDNCSVKEDFYIALVKHQEKTPEDPAVPPRPLRYRQKDIISLVQRLHSSEDHLQMNWVNGLLGRVFLSIYRTPEIEEFFRSKITKKISRVNKPNFLSDIKLQHITVGDAVPYITNPRLKEMTADGDFCAEADVAYSGGFRLEITTKATLNLGARFKPREVTLVLAVVLKRLEGHAVIRIKPPPSNRLWVSFERMPKMDLSIEPIVGSRQVAWGPILRIIEGRIREVVAETVVLPHYDDIPFTDTIDQRFRGGVWHGVKNMSAPVQAVTSKDVVDVRDTNLIDIDIPDQRGDDDDSLSSSFPAMTFTGDIPKAASTSELPDGTTSKTSSSSPSVKSERKSRTPRTHTLHSISPPSPSIGTDTINAMAERGQNESIDTPDATAAIMAIRSRSHSGVQSQAPELSFLSGRPQAFPAKMGVDINGESFRPPSQDSSSIDHASTSVGSISGGSAQSFGSNASHPSSITSGSRNGTTKSVPEKTTMAAIGTATAAVKKWYNTRKNAPSGDNSGDGSRQSREPTPSRNLPPANIPPPPAKKTQPISVPKRKNLPPPVVPQRRSRNVPAPALPAREQNGELLVVAAPVSDPSTPQDEHGPGFPGQEYAESLDSSDSIGSRRSRDGSGSWERKHLRERAVEESELWHPAEEAEMRTRVPWEPDEL